jgi:hypothetical protein
MEICLLLVGGSKRISRKAAKMQSVAEDLDYKKRQQDKLGRYPEL